MCTACVPGVLAEVRKWISDPQELESRTLWVLVFLSKVN